MAATCGRYIQTVPLDPDESYELGGLTRDAEDKHCSTRNLVTEQAGDVSFVGVGHVGIRALADFRQPYPLSPSSSVSRAFLAGFATKRVRRGHERRSPLAREMVSRDLCHRRPPPRPAPRRSRAAGLPSTSPTAPAVSESAPLDARPRRTGLAVNSRTSSSCLAPSEVVELGGILGRRKCADAKKAPNEFDMVEDGRAANA